MRKALMCDLDGKGFHAIVTQKKPSAVVIIS